MALAFPTTRGVARSGFLWQLFLVLLLELSTRHALAFVSPRCHHHHHHDNNNGILPRHDDSTTVHSMMVADASFDMTTAASSSMLLSTESWRQYVPLVVSLLVITDILLGSPAANAVLSVMRPKEEGDEQGGGNSPLDTLLGKPSAPSKDLKERVDSMAVAQQALEKAAATKELRKFLDESKSDMEKMRDVQKKLDEQLAQFDKKQAEKDGK